MQSIVKNSSKSDDEEDLESLRLAALQSLKRPGPSINNGFDSTSCTTLSNPKPFNGNPKRRTKAFHAIGRAPRNGYNRMRNTNLIAVPTIELEHSHESLPDISNKLLKEKTLKLILPQDRYCNTNIPNENKTPEMSSKFDRFNDSEESESEDEDEKVSMSESPKNIKRSNSLEALMQELENEIQGNTKAIASQPSKSKMKLKKPRKLKDSPQTEDLDKTKIESISKSTGDKDYQSKDVNTACQELLKINNETVTQETSTRRKSKSPVKTLSTNQLCTVKSPMNNFSLRKSTISQPVHNLQYVNSNIIPTALPPFQPLPYSNFRPLPLPHTVPYNVPIPYTFPNLRPMPGNEKMCLTPNQMFPTNNYKRPVSPLTINTNVLNTVTAPLSPRSAAFVLQNHEIIERRKKSPRRSYSRSPSPEFRRSLSPRYRRSNSRPLRSPSLPKSVRKISPTRRSPPNYKRSSPGISQHTSSSHSLTRRPSPNKYRSSPSRISTSGSSQNSPKHARRSSPKTNSESKLEVTPSDEKTTNNPSRSTSLSLSPSPERFASDEGSTVANPVLEARKRKFEVNGAVPTEGIIRLKPKIEMEESADANTDENESKVEELNEEELLTGGDTFIDCDVNMDDLFSDEESDSENEGRFKLSDKQDSSRGVTIVPFSQLLTNSSKNVTSEALDKKRSPYDRDRDQRDKNRPQKRSRERVRSRSKSPERRRFKDSRDRIKRRQRSRSLPKTHSRPTAKESKQPNRSEIDRSSAERRSKNSSGVKSDHKRSPVVTTPIENRKIDVKIRSSKYEVSESKTYEDSNKNKCSEDAKEKTNNIRKVKVTNDPLVQDKVEDEDIENEEEDEDIVIKNEGASDLRAQLSRKRAERQNKLPKVERVQSRLLQNALQGAVFKKSELKKKENEAAPSDNAEANVYAAILRTRSKSGDGTGDTEISCSTECKERKVRILHCDMEPLPIASDGKLPIHLRLGVPGKSEVFNDSKGRRKRKRSKNKGNFDQV